MLPRWSVTCLGCCLLLAVTGVPVAISAQATSPWTFRSRLVMSGSTDHSEPAGFTMYSGIALEAALARRLSDRFAVELAVRTESREVDRVVSGPITERLGSLELLPVNLLVQWHPARSGSVRPYLGAGMNFTVAWEKSGVLDSLDVSPQIGGALQVGVLVPLSGRVAFNADVRWNSLATDIRAPGGRFALLTVDPIALGLGLELAF
jgi:outer membrane protein